MSFLNFLLIILRQKSFWSVSEHSELLNSEVYYNVGHVLAQCHCNQILPYDSLQKEIIILLSCKALCF